MAKSASYMKKYRAKKNTTEKPNNLNEVELSKLSYSELEKLIEIEQQIKEETASGHTQYLQGVPGGSKQDHERYVLAHKRYNELQGEIRRRLKESTKNVSDSWNNANTEHKKFINGYGEATDKYITTTTYENAMRKTKRNVENWIGIR